MAMLMSAISIRPKHTVWLVLAELRQILRPEGAIRGIVENLSGNGSRTASRDPKATVVNVRFCADISTNRRLRRAWPQYGEPSLRTT
jgi:hypothetical protein